MMVVMVSTAKEAHWLGYLVTMVTEIYFVKRQENGCKYMNKHLTLRLVSMIEKERNEMSFIV